MRTCFWRKSRDKRKFEYLNLKYVYITWTYIQSHSWPKYVTTKFKRVLCENFLAKNFETISRTASKQEATSSIVHLTPENQRHITSAQAM